MRKKRLVRNPRTYENVKLFANKGNKYLHSEVRNLRYNSRCDEPGSEVTTEETGGLNLIVELTH